MTTIRLKSNSLRGANLSLSASQSGATDSGSATDWGSGTYAGELQIDVDRSVLQTAPDSVRFEVNLDKTTFDAKALPDGEGWAPPHDDRLYQVIFLWDFGETRNYTAPTYIHPNWVSARYAKGPWVAHCYHPDSISGDWQDFTVTCTAYEPSSGKTAVATTTIRVYHPDYTYSGSRPGFSNFKTYVVNPNGDSDFTGKPTGATELELDGTHGAAANVFSESITAWTTERTAGNQVRWLFKRGGSYTASTSIASGDTRYQYVGAYGSGARPVWVVPGVGVDFSGTWRVGADIPEYRLVDIDMDGGFDPATDNWGSNGTAGGTNPNAGGVNSSAFTPNCSSILTVQNSEISGMWNEHCETNVDAEEMHIHFDNVLFHEFCNKTEYNIHMEKNAGPDNWTTQSTCAWTGVANIMPPVGPSYFYNFTSGGTDWHHGLFRTNYKGRIHLRSCDFFHQGRTNGMLNPHAKSEAESTWDMIVSDGSEDFEATFPRLYPPDGAIVNIHSCAFEGTLGTVGRLHPDSIWGQIVFKAFIVDECLFTVGLYKGGEFTFYAHGGAVRNCLGFCASRNALPGSAFGWRSLLFTGASGYHDRGRRAPVRIYNNTVVLLHTDAQNTTAGKANLQRATNQSAFGGPIVEKYNNILSAPNYGNFNDTDEAEALNYWSSDIDLTSELTWFTHRTVGETGLDAQVGTLDTTDTTCAPVEAHPRTGQPLAGSTITDAGSSAGWLSPYAPFGKSVADMIANPASGVFDKRGCWAEQAA